MKFEIEWQHNVSITTSNEISGRWKKLQDEPQRRDPSPSYLLSSVAVVSSLSQLAMQLAIWTGSSENRESVGVSAARTQIGLGLAG